MKMTRLMVVSGLGLSALASVANAQFSLYNDRGSFISALGGASVGVETFTGGISTPGLGVVSGGGGSVAIDLWADLVRSNPPELLTTTWTMPTGTFAWGADFDLDFGALNTAGVEFSVDGVPVFGAAAPRSGFLGFIFNGAGSFNTVTVRAGTTGPGEDFTMDNLTYAVPAPGGAALLGAAGLLLSRRRR